MKRIGSRKARKILDFLAKRAGYETFVLKQPWNCAGIVNIVFYAKNDSELGWEDENEVLINEFGQLKILGFQGNVSEERILKMLFKNKNDIFVGKGMNFNESNGLVNLSPWVKVFKKNESLESLMIQCDLLEAEE